MSFSLYGMLILAGQVITGVHAYRQGKYFWILLIIVLPLLGMLIYFFAEMLPTMRLERRLQSTGKQVADTLQPGRRLKQLEEALEDQDTIALRQAYAEELLVHERYDDAIKILEEGLTGVFVNDSQGLFTLANAYFQKGDAAKAEALLETLIEDDPSFEASKVKLLYARALEAQEKTESAITIYRDLAGRNLSEEPRFYLLRALDKLGQGENWDSIFEQSQKFYDRSSRIYKQENQAWMKQIKQLADKRSS